MQIRVRIGNEDRLLPTSWESAGDLAWPCLRELARKGANEGKLRAIRLLAGFNNRQLRSLSDEQLAGLVEGLSWLQISPVSVPLRLSFWHRGVKYGLPSAKFEDDSAIAFALADDFFASYHDGDDQALHYLLAVLARPLRNGTRQPLSGRDEALRRGQRLRNVPPEWLAAAWMYWAGVKRYVHDTYGPWLFQNNEPAEEEEEDPEPATGADSGPNFGWWGKFMEVAESGVFGNLSKVHQNNFHEICIYLVKKEAEARQQRKEIERIQTQKR